MTHSIGTNNSYIRSIFWRSTPRKRDTSDTYQTNPTHGRKDYVRINNRKRRIKRTIKNKKFKLIVQIISIVDQKVIKTIKSK